tara:strand:+ start:4011 stop:4223 length:213 start_codon:yes stop_codon:yes gene_type:complete
MIQEWVIWGTDNNGELVNTIKTCKKPAYTKLYKDLIQRFNDAELDEVGYVTLEQLRKDDNWINIRTKATV